MPMKLILRLSFLLLMITVPSLAQEQKMTDSEAAVFRQNVGSVAKRIKSLTTDFTQYKHMDFLAKDIETSGRMSFKEPSMLQWQYLKPYNYSIVFKKGKILINDEGRKSQMDAGSSKIFAKLNKLIVGSVSGDMFDDDEFVITYFKTKTQNIARLVPKDPALKKYLKQVELSFDPADAMVTQVRLIETAEDFTRIVFRNKKINVPISDAVFSN